MQKTANGHPSVQWGRRRLSKIFLVMKLTALFLTIAFVHAFAGTKAQQITISGKDFTYVQVFAAIKKQTGYVVAATPDLFAGNRKISLTVKDLPLKEFLDIILKDQPFMYDIDGKTIFISRKKVNESAGTTQQITSAVLPDNTPVTGVVFSEKNTPLSGVSVLVKKTNRGTITDNQGGFTIQAETGDILSFSSVGYTSQEVKVTGGTVIVKLKLAVSMLDETQIIAYGKTTKRLSTGNIGTIKGEDIEKQPVFTVLEAIAGRVPGVIITPMQGNSAAPVKVNIRGRNTINPNVISDPLYVVDGVPLNNLNSSPWMSGVSYQTGAVQAGRTILNGENPLLSINPKDIESIDILKDADATAIYGSRGANGVILITTKRGKPGPTSFSLQVANGFKSVMKYPKLMNTEQYLAVRREAFLNDGITPNRFNAPDLTIWDQQKYTDWQRSFGSSGNELNVNAGLSGGMGQTVYRISANHTSTTELFNNGGGNKRSSLSLSLGHASINQKFKLDFNTSMALSDLLVYSTSGLNSLPPNAPDLFDAKGKLNFEPYRGENSSLYELGVLKRSSSSKSFYLQSTLMLQYEILKGLQVSVNAGFNTDQNENNTLTPSASLDLYYPSQTSLAYFGSSNRRSFNIDPQIMYRTMIGRGRLTAQLIASMQESESRGLTTEARDFPNDNLIKSQNNARTRFTGEGYAQHRYLSAAGIIKYSWDDKYVISLNARRDGSSRFGPGKRFGDFGSIGLAWIMSDENWVRSVMPEWMSFVKLRGSVGTTGSDNIGDYEFLSRWGNTLSLTNDRIQFGYMGLNSFSILRALYQDFQWESTRKSELAAQFGFLQNKLNLEISYYSNLSSNQLTQVPMPVYTGFQNVTANWPAKVRNSGIEAALNWNAITTKDWGLTFNFNIGRNRNKLVDFPGMDDTRYKSEYKIGDPLTVRYMLHYTGIDPLTGEYSFEDHNKNGVIDNSGGVVPAAGRPDDRYVKLDLAPKYSGGFGFNLTWRQLAVSSQFTFINKLSPDPYLQLRAGDMDNSMMPADILENHWKKPGDIVKYAKFTTVTGTSITNADAYYTNGSYVRMSTLSIRYQAPEKWVRKVHMKNASIGISSNNLFTITSYKGFDPDISTLNGLSPIPRIIATNLIFNF
ncbi:TonB-linked SusC/RagA family outer membrane protein [Pseudobacter ginsenosidimutans]|uniref:TonB-linked SusC/RagA family outer membrane protein n=2 Tax=Pseudobacter ginsenosidimutans TaxID=661488 RepID=A0A4Q7N2Q4_9BACT|nr:TonB-linked SusC/RagA family outer membrane protein [Pseudobacter ginsenosidimutans]